MLKNNDENSQLRKCLISVEVITWSTEVFHLSDLFFLDSNVIDISVLVTWEDYRNARTVML